MDWKVFMDFLIISLIDGFSSAVEFEPCFHAVKDEPCNMTCIVPDFSQDMQISCNGTTRGSCTVFACNSFIKEGVDKLVFPILSLSYTSDNCDWMCTYGTSSSIPKPVKIVSKYIIEFNTIHPRVFICSMYVRSRHQPIKPHIPGM